jgi:hypothetical protein
MAKKKTAKSKRPTTWKGASRRTKLGVKLGPPKTVRIFVASPGDVAKERKILQELTWDLDNMLQGVAEVSVRFEGWENVVPSLGRAQSLINPSVDNADVFVGVMWNRFGTETGDFDSGTEEEFELALAKWKDHGEPWVLFYFSDLPCSLNTTAELDQKAKVLEFKEKVQAAGLTDKYSNLEEFRRKALRHLGSVLLRIICEK